MGPWSGSLPWPLHWRVGVPQTIETGPRTPRAKLSQPMRVRPYDSHLPEEICVTKNVSRKGFYFETSLAHYFPGMYAHVTRNFHKSDCLSLEEAAHVVRVERLKTGMAGVAVHILPEIANARASQAKANSKIVKLDHRRTGRARVKIPLFLYGVFEDAPFVEGAHTIEINAHGALIAMKTAVPPGARLLLTNETNERTQECTVLPMRARRAQCVQGVVAVAFGAPAPEFWRKSQAQNDPRNVPAQKTPRRGATTQER
jgi:hypothetical protein